MTSLSSVTATATLVATSAPKPTGVPTGMPKLAPGQFPPGYIPNYPRLAGWDSAGAAYAVMSLILVMTLFILFNLVRAGSTHTRTIYAYLLMWCVFRLACFGLRGHALDGNNGSDLETYQWAQIVASIGFMPLAEVSTFNLLAGTTVVYKLTPLGTARLKALVQSMFAVFVICVAAFAYDFTKNKAFGSDVKDHTSDLVLREIGFNGLLGITIYTVFASLRDALMASRKQHVDPELVAPLQKTMYVIFFQSLVMIVKLVFITYRNWNPSELKEEKYWYTLSILPELVFVLAFCTPRYLVVFDALAQHETNGVIPPKVAELTLVSTTVEVVESKELEYIEPVVETEKEAVTVTLDKEALGSEHNEVLKVEGKGLELLAESGQI
ncbi:hypothetical protein BC830DRAFT_896832 [Chytriomyces sp. MP71]|nr:hypothetical protein BC830DRAFT_896832 [Chytriomyces sp. MP71]